MIDNDLGDVLVEKADGVKCPRCWRVHPVRVNFEDLCDRCQEVILMDFPNHPRVPDIKAALAMQREVLSWKWGESS